MGSAHYLAHEGSAGTLRKPAGRGIDLQTLGYGEVIDHHGVRLSLHPRAMCWARPRCASNMAARCGWPRATMAEDDGTCPPFEPGALPHLHHRIDLWPPPIYRWPSQPALFADINAWWAANAAAAGQRAVCVCLWQGAAAAAWRGCQHPGPSWCMGRWSRSTPRTARRVWICRPRCVTDPGLTKADLKTRAGAVAPPLGSGHTFGSSGLANARRVCEWLDAGARRTPTPGRGPGLCDERPRRLAQPAKAIGATGAERVIVTTAARP